MPRLLSSPKDCETLENYGRAKAMLAMIQPVTLVGPGNDAGRVEALLMAMGLPVFTAWEGPAGLYLLKR